MVTTLIPTDIKLIMENNCTELILREPNFTSLIPRENANIVKSSAFMLLRIFNKEFLLTKKVHNYDKLNYVLDSMGYNRKTEHNSEAIFYLKLNQLTFHSQSILRIHK